MDAFRFSPELFELRSDVQAALDEAGFDWFTHYSSVDPVHDLYGIEVCGIVEPDDAQSILTLLRAMFPSWGHAGICFKDYGREPGYKARVYRDQPREPEQWESA
jgi:hypothetical protein